MLSGRFTEALALEREPVSIVHQALENGIGKDRLFLILLYRAFRRFSRP
jgi:hypothetical protein